MRVRSRVRADTLVLKPSPLRWGWRRTDRARIAAANTLSRLVTGSESGYARFKGTSAEVNALPPIYR